MANALETTKKETKNEGFGFVDLLPIPIQAIIGVISLAVVFGVGLGVFFLIDILLLDFDPIGTVVKLIAGAIGG